MAKLYFNMILRGTWTFAKVPSSLKSAVRQMLIDEGLEELAEDE